MLVGATSPLALRNCHISIVVALVVVVLVVVVVVVVVFVVVIVFVVVLVVVFFMKLQIEIPRPCRAKSIPGVGGLKSPQVRSLGPAERKRIQSQNPKPCEGFKVLTGSPQARSPDHAERKRTPELDSSALVGFPSPGGRPKGLTGEIPRLCRGKESQSESPWPCQAKGTLARPSTGSD